MARRLNTFEASAVAPTTVESRRRVDRSTARALAAAIASLVIATLVVSGSTQALHPEGTASSNELQAGSITLVDDDLGRSLVELDNMAPGRPSQQCISVGYAGTVLPVSLTLSATSQGDIAEYVLVTIERGSAASFGSCDGFLADGAAAFSGRVGDLVVGEPVPVGTMRNEGQSISFRFTFDLADEAAAEGRAGSVDFVWEAVP